MPDPWSLHRMTPVELCESGIVDGARVSVAYHYVEDHLGTRHFVLKLDPTSGEWTSCRLNGQPASRLHDPAYDSLMGPLRQRLAAHPTWGVPLRWAPGL